MVVTVVGMEIVGFGVAPKVIVTIPVPLLREMGEVGSHHDLAVADPLDQADVFGSMITHCENFRCYAVVDAPDITDEHNAKVTASDLDRFSSLAEMLPFGILSADARGWVVYSNEAARHILNLSKDMVGGHG